MGEMGSNDNIAETDSAFIELAIEIASLDQVDNDEEAARAARSVVLEAAKIHRTIEE